MTYYVNLRSSALRYDTHIIIIYHCDKMIAGIMQSTSSLCQRDALNVLGTICAETHAAAVSRGGYPD